MAAAGPRLVALSVGLACAAPGELAAGERVTVAVDLKTLDEQSFEALEGLALEKRLVVRLVEEGFAVVAVSEKPDMRSE